DRAALRPRQENLHDELSDAPSHDLHGGGGGRSCPRTSGMLVQQQRRQQLRQQLDGRGNRRRNRRRFDVLLRRLLELRLGEQLGGKLVGGRLLPCGHR